MKKRVKRKTVGARDSKTGRYVALKRLKSAPTRTVAVTKEVKAVVAPSMFQSGQCSAAVERGRRLPLPPWLHWIGDDQAEQLAGA